MTGPEATAAMKADDVDAVLVEKAERTLAFGICRDNLPEPGATCDCPTDVQIRVIIAAVLPEIQAQALRDEADRSHTYHFSTGDRVEPVHSERARHLLHESAARLTATTEETPT